MTNLVQVQFRNRYGSGYSGAAYTYRADVPLSVGDVVTVPTKWGDSEARVCRVDVPEAEVAKFHRSSYARRRSVRRLFQVIPITTNHAKGDLHHGN